MPRPCRPSGASVDNGPFPTAHAVGYHCGAPPGLMKAATPATLSRSLLKQSGPPLPWKRRPGRIRNRLFFVLIFVFVFVLILVLLVDLGVLVDLLDRFLDG